MAQPCDPRLYVFVAAGVSWRQVVSKPLRELVWLSSAIGVRISAELFKQITA